MFIPFRVLVRSVLRDRISIFYAVVFPMLLLLILGIVFSSQTYRFLLVGGTMALSIVFFSTNGLAFESLAQRTQGVYKLLRVTPYRTSAFLVSLTNARAIVALVSALGVLVFGKLVFAITFNWSAVLLLIPLLLVANYFFAFLGLFIANVAGNEGQVNVISNILTLPLIFGSESFYSLANGPGWVRTLNAYNPMGFFIRGIHAALLGDGSSTLQPLLALTMWAGGALVVATLTFRWEAPDGSAGVRRHIATQTV